ncbi:MupA/Atu3671 family FMN-dependent luciferase-like monooxygenase [Amycolatopsis minnesotensis]|uniref:LLM class flavin-dependent oxidoreductase n=1 Tax=Amycolatopsis minnesotensis TaxID=337894 RepID=A0ABN2R7Q9_9PSEU
MDFSLFYFANGDASDQQRYRLLLDGARFADEHGFAAVWTPERHFHEFGGLYPNPAVTSAAVAAVTSRIGIRAGSVVGPLHHPVRIAEEWSVVDNLSAGRVGLSFASGWHAVDFVLRPENYADRRDIVRDTIKTVKSLWRGETVEFPDGTGERAGVRVFPSPVRADLPVWLTSAGSPETFRAAGELGVGVLTHLLGQDLDDLAKKIAEYRRAYAEHHVADGGTGHVALMLHTFLGDDRAKVRDIVHDPFCDYLRSSIGLIARASGDILPDVKPEDLDPEDVEFLVEHSFDRYFDTGGLFGTVDDGMRVLDRLSAVGIDDIACLIDFVADTDAVLGGLDHLATLRDRWEDAGHR